MGSLFRSLETLFQLNTIQRITETNRQSHHLLKRDRFQLNTIQRITETQYQDFQFLD